MENLIQPTGEICGKKARTKTIRQPDIPTSAPFSPELPWTFATSPAAMIFPYIAVAFAILGSAQSSQQPDYESITGQSLTVDGSGPDQILWSKVTPQTHPFVPPGVFSFGISYLARSPAYVSDRDFLVTGLEVLQHAYYTNANFSALVRNYVWDMPPYSHTPTPLNISAVGRGLDEGLPITFNNGAMMLFVRWLGQVSKPHKWQGFRCHFGWVEGGKPREDVVAVGNFTSFAPTALPPQVVRF